MCSAAADRRERKREIEGNEVVPHPACFFVQLQFASLHHVSVNETFPVPIKVMKNIVINYLPS